MALGGSLPQINLDVQGVIQGVITTLQRKFVSVQQVTTPVDLERGRDTVSSQQMSSLQIQTFPIKFKSYRRKKNLGGSLTQPSIDPSFQLLSARLIVPNLHWGIKPIPFRGAPIRELCPITTSYPTLGIIGVFQSNGFGSGPVQRVLLCHGCPSAVVTPAITVDALFWKGPGDDP
ncbi:hypothetical protein TNCV_1501391 [Trichonephila clavipes]|uniref:Uncharacterized protein n=1 Tax=Trichonephila clavipes TaxID=2585209 RepID=A0A8X6RN53_TRICX|nr:hypothetical protein TNCV_1501391 [Trichonephila clavipes]